MSVCGTVVYALYGHITTGANRSFKPQARAKAGSRSTAETNHVGWVMLGGLQPGNLGASTTTQMDYNTDGSHS